MDTDMETDTHTDRHRSRRPELVRAPCVPTAMSHPRGDAGTVVPLAARSRSRRSGSLVSAPVGPRRRWRRGSVPDGPAPPATPREVQHDDGTDRRKSLRNKHLMNKKHLPGRFRLVVKLAVFCARQAREHRLKDKLYDEIMPYVNDLRFHDYEQTAEEAQRILSFDPSSFKADKQLRISEDAKRVLTTPPRDRTEKQITYAQLALRNIYSIAEYPVRMQKKIVEVGRYEKYDAKRVVVRQGHPATAFYFILSGSVVVMVSDPETKMARPVAYLPRGKPFGELAIIRRTTRQASVVAKETLELLSIDIEDFHRIFMSGGVKNIHDPDHNSFVRNLSYLKQWPLEKMVSEPDKCQFLFLKQGELVVRDSRVSSWLFIVKSGSLQVLKKLKRVEAFESKSKEAPPALTVLSDKEMRDEQEARDKQRRHVLPDLRIPLRAAPDSPPHVMRPPPVTCFKEADSNRVQRLVRWTRGPGTRRDGEGTRPDDPETVRDGVCAAVGDASYPGDMDGHQEPDAGQGGRFVTSLSTIPASATSTSTAWVMTNAHVTSTDSQADSGRHHPGSPNKVAPASQKSRTGRTKQEEEQAEMEREMKGRKQEVRTITQDLDAGYRQQPEVLTDADLDPQFVHVQTLTKGQVFGLSELILGRQPSFCVVSNGAECILLDKQLYLAHAPEHLLRKLRNDCCPYPTDEEMQDGLQVSVDWEAYKNVTFRETMTLIHEKKNNKQSWSPRR